SLLNGRDEFFRNDTTYDVINKLQSFFSIHTRPDFEDDIRKLTATTGLLLVNFLMFDRGRKRFFVSYLRSALVDLYLELALEAVDDDLKVKFAHAAQDSLTSLLVGVNPKGWILFYQLRNSHSQFIRIRLLLRFNGVTDNRLWKHHRFQNYFAFLITKGVARLDVLKAHHSTDISAMQTLDLILLVGVHLKHARDSFFLSGTRIVDVRARLEHARVCPDKAQTTHERIGCNVKGKRRERLTRIRLD